MLKNKNVKKLALVKAVALATFASALSAGGPNPSISLEQTVGTDLAPMACGTDAVIAVDPGTSVNFCYTVTNDGNEPFELHDLDTSAFGSIFAGQSYLLNPTESVSINDIRSVSNNVVNVATWDASQSPFTVTVLSGVDFEYTDISGTGTALGNGDEGEVNVVIPFSFEYFGSTSTDLRVGSNGAVLFGVTTGDVDFNPLALPTQAPDNQPIIAPFWTDLDDSSNPGSDVYWQVDGVAPNQTLTVEWHDRKEWNGDDLETVTFQLVLFEGTNEIQFRYFDTTWAPGTGGSNASIGIDSGNEVDALQYSLNGSTLVNDMTTVSIVPAAGVPQSATDSSTAAVSVLAPQVAVNPGSLGATIDVDGTASETLVISNDGQGSLQWSVNEATAPAVLPRPYSSYMPEPQANQSYLPAPKKGASKGKRPNNKIALGGGSTGYAFDVFNGSFGNFDVTDGTVYNNLGANAQSFFAGDFAGDDFTTMYSVEFNNAGEDSLYSVDTTDGSSTLIGVLAVTASGDPATENWSGLSWDSTTGTMYGSSTNGTNSWLYTIDLGTATATLVGEITNSALMIDIAFSPSGQLYGHDIGLDSILSVDKSTGAGTVIGATGFDANFAQGMDFYDSPNTLYLAAYNNVANDEEIRTVDLQTGATTLVGTFPGQNELDSFGVAASGDPCYLAEDISWLSLSETSGVVGSGDTDEVTVDYDAAGLMVGVYNAQVCVFSNDMDEPLVSVPVTLEVSDLIYANSFEAPAP
jgi:hypothetical protein